MNDENMVDIPASALVHCPLHKLALRRAQKCEGCKHFLGLNEKLSGASVPFNGQYQVVCSAPMLRSIEIEAEG